MMVSENFFYYKKGVFVSEGEFVGGHAVRIIGWGQEDGQNYWLV